MFLQGADNKTSQTGTFNCKFEEDEYNWTPIHDPFKETVMDSGYRRRWVPVPSSNIMTLTIAPDFSPHYDVDNTMRILAGELSPLPTLSEEEKEAGCTITIKIQVRRSPSNSSGLMN